MAIKKYDTILQSYKFFFQEIPIKLVILMIKLLMIIIYSVFNVKYKATKTQTHTLSQINQEYIGAIFGHRVNWVMGVHRRR